MGAARARSLLSSRRRRTASATSRAFRALRAGPRLGRACSWLPTDGTSPSLRGRSSIAGRAHACRRGRERANIPGGRRSGGHRGRCAGCRIHDMIVPWTTQGVSAKNVARTTGRWLPRGGCWRAGGAGGREKRRAPSLSGRRRVALIAGEWRFLTAGRKVPVRARARGRAASQNQEREPAPQTRRVRGSSIGSRYHVESLEPTLVNIRQPSRLDARGGADGAIARGVVRSMDIGRDVKPAHVEPASQDVGQAGAQHMRKSRTAAPTVGRRA